MSSHHYSLFTKDPLTRHREGYRIDAKSIQFPVLRGLAISYLKLEKEGMREPHWHPNAHELNYCISGQALLTLFNPGNNHETFLLQPGDISFVPMGSLHHVANVGEGPLEMLVCFSDDKFEDLSLSAAISVMSPKVMGTTFQVNPEIFSKLTKTQEGVFICSQKKRPFLELSYSNNAYKFGLEKKLPEVKNSGGEVRMSNQALFPPLNSIAVYSLFLEKGGIREPHWHPNAHELNCVISGSVKITLLSPGGQVETFNLNKGDISFLPRGYLHHIENTSGQKVHMVIFFNDVFPQDIGLTGSLGAYPNSILESLFNVPSAYFDKLPKYQEDLFVVGGG